MFLKESKKCYKDIVVKLENNKKWQINILRKPGAIRTYPKPDFQGKPVTRLYITNCMNMAENHTLMN